MKKHILIILVLMSLCVTGVVGLQLFWNYQNYKTTVRAFDHDINEALTTAVAQETDQRQDQIVKRFKGWLADTSLIIITADHKNRDSMTVFYTQDAHPKFKEDKKRKAQFGLNDFKEKLDHITPKAKAYMIEHFGDRILKRDLKAGVVYTYTQMLGDSLEKVFNDSKMNPQALQSLFRQELLAKHINASFVLNPEKNTNLYLTRAINTNFRKPYKNDFVIAGFESPDVYFFGKMKWVIISSLTLIIITIGCFGYTVRTLLSQQKLAELKDAFVNNMTHELNTPISSIKITAEALRSFNHNQETQKDYLDIITYQADKLGNLTGQILNTGRLIKINILTKGLVDLNNIMAKALTDLTPQIESYHASITYHPLRSGPHILGDHDSLLNVFINVIDNALKYSRSVPAIVVDIAMSPGYAIVTIADQGIGIPPEYHNSVFDQFFRVPQANLHDVKGFGLGLNYVKQIIKQHQGDVTIITNQPSGSIFTIKLPLAK